MLDYCKKMGEIFIKLSIDRWIATFRDCCADDADADRSQSR